MEIIFVSFVCFCLVRTSTFFLVAVKSLFAVAFLTSAFITSVSADCNSFFHFAIFFGIFLAGVDFLAATSAFSFFWASIAFVLKSEAS